MDEAVPNGLPPETFAAQLHAAVVSGSIPELESLLQALQGGSKSAAGQLNGITKNYSVDAPDIDLYTPLHRAVECGNVQMCELLLDAGADVNVSHPGLDGWTPLHLACWLNAKEIVDLLLRRGADAEAQDWYANRARDLGEEETQRFVAQRTGAGGAEAGCGLEWKTQNLVAPCSMTASKVQADMIAFSIKHCAENDIGGEWVETTQPQKAEDTHTEPL